MSTLDPKAAFGAAKTPLHLIPPSAKAAQARVHAVGAEKYRPYNWRENQVCSTTYISAMLRHIDDFLDGHDIDADSGLPNLAHVACNCNILIDAKAHGTLVDDRPPSRTTPPPTKEQEALARIMTMTSEALAISPLYNGVSEIKHRVTQINNIADSALQTGAAFPTK